MQTFWLESGRFKMAYTDSKRTEDSRLNYIHCLHYTVFTWGNGFGAFDTQAVGKYLLKKTYLQAMPLYVKRHQTEKCAYDLLN